MENSKIIRAAAAFSLTVGKYDPPGMAVIASSDDPGSVGMAASVLGFDGVKFTLDPELPTATTILFFPPLAQQEK